VLNPVNMGSGMNSFSETASSYSIIKRVAKEKGVHPSSLTGESIFDAANQGDVICTQAIAEFYQMLAVGLYNIQYVYDPELILIGGGISNRKELISRLNDEIEAIV